MRSSHGRGRTESADCVMLSTAHMGKCGGLLPKGTAGGDGVHRMVCAGMVRGVRASLDEAVLGRRGTTGWLEVLITDVQ